MSSTTFRLFFTGSLGLDIALGIGGLPRGRVVEIYGPELGRRDAHPLQVIAEMQNSEELPRSLTRNTLLIRPTPRSSASIWTICLFPQPDTGEQALEIADMLVRSASVDVVVIDSVAALVPKAEIEGGHG